MGLGEAPMAVVFAEIVLETIGRRKCPGAAGGSCLVLLCPCCLSWGSFEEVSPSSPLHLSLF